MATGIRKNIVWLASYPKSGNTWTRIFLANYLFNRKEPIPINEVHRLGFGDSIAKAYRLVARGPLDVTDHRATLALREAVLRGITGNGADINFVKTHNIREVALGVELIPAQYSRAAIYILRNPLDMVLSYARHYNMTAEAVAAAIGRTDNAIAGDRETVPQFLGSWSRHVRSWSERAPFPVLVLRYEDLQTDAASGFRSVLGHLGVPVDEERLARATRFSGFDEVSRQEASAGFVERSPTADRFFHSGTSGQWRTALAPETVERITRDHAAAMRQHGYLP